MAENRVEFTIAADSKPAGEAILKLSQLINKAIRKSEELKSNGTFDKSLNKSVTAYEKIAKALDKSFKDAKGLEGVNFNRYFSNKAAIDKWEQLPKNSTQRKADAERIKALKAENKAADEYAAGALKNILGTDTVIQKTEDNILGIRKTSKAELEASTKNAEQEASAKQQAAQSEQMAADAAKQNAAATNAAAQAADTLNSASKKNEAVDAEKKTRGKTRPVGAPDDLQKAADEAKRVAEEFANVRAKVNDALSFKGVSTDIASLTEKLLKLQAAQKAVEKADMPKEFHGAYNQIYAEIEQTKQAILTYKQSMRSVDAEHQKAEKSGVSFGQKLSGAFKTLKKAGAGIGSLLKSVKSGFGGLDKSTNKVKASFDSMARNMRSNFKHMLRNITKYVFGFRSLFFLVRRLRGQLKEGIENLVKYEAAIGQSKSLKSTNQAINQLRTSLLYLKNAWAAAFAPIINAVTPFLTYLIDKLAAAGNAIAKFMGVLTNKSSVLNAVKTPAKDYAKSLDKAGSSAGNAAKKQKKLNDRIAEFDDLILLGRDKDNDDGNGSGGGGGNNDDDYDYSKMFKKVKAVSNLAKMIKQAWKTADFTKVGEYLRDKLINSIDKAFSGNAFEKATKTAAKIGKSVATFLNGVFQDEKIWIKLGEAIGKSFNLVGTALDNFFKNNKVDWGKGLATLINNMFTNIDEKLLKNNIKAFVDLIVDNVVSFLTTMKWDEVQKKSKVLGESLGYALEKTFKNPEFAKALGKSAGELVNTVSKFLSGVLNPGGDDLFGGPGFGSAGSVSIGEALAQFLINAFKTINWKDFTKNLVTIWNGLFKALSDLFDHEEELDEIAATLGEAFEKIDWTEYITNAVNAALKIGKFGTKVFALISNAISDAIINADPKEVEDAVKQFIEGINVDDFMDSCEILGEAIIKSLVASGLLVKVAAGIIGGIFGAMGDYLNEHGVDTEGLGELLTNQFLAGIGGPLANAVDWAYNNIFTPIANGIKEAFGLTDEGSGESKSWGEAIIHGIEEGISNAFDVAVDWVKKWLVDPIVDGFVSLFQIGSPSKVTEDWGGYLISGLENGLWNNISGITDFWKNLKSDITNTWSTTVDNVLAKTELLKQRFKEIWDKLGTAIKDPINGIIGIVESMVNKIIAGINGITRRLNSLPNLEFKNPFTGKEYALGFKIPELSNVKLPRLAQGAVIPPNREFMAVLGDQKNGTNIEAPLDTIKQAVAEVMANNGNQEMIQLLQELITVVEHKNLVIGDKEIGRANARYNKQQSIVRGTSF